MLKEIIVINSTQTGLLESSFTGNMVVDAAFDARLAKHLKQRLNNSDVAVRTGDVDDLEQPQDRLFVVSNRVATVINLKANDHVILYADMDGVVNKGIDALAKRVNSYVVKNTLFN
ncbi:hypothetical protein D1831_02145 [Lactiplantibacillus garii]|uniref:Uncharacterized protein n=1 Tax=Lactiplantibacillus garii TaxID=2306423 RepID=A0A426DAD5_9LACO|nr:hypothetical protein [Lactiplantibacillus garii]RRK11513.1 hypothetical protein D1831_02145 [Lactiplantibacillus garii]